MSKNYLLKETNRRFIQDDLIDFRFSLTWLGRKNVMIQRYAKKPISLLAKSRWAS